MNILEKIKGIFIKKDGSIKKAKLKPKILIEIKRVKDGELKTDSLEKLNRLFRLFLEDEYGIKQSLTYEELKKELSKGKNKKGKKILEIESKINKLMYDPRSQKINKKEFGALAEQIIKTIN